MKKKLIAAAFVASAILGPGIAIADAEANDNANCLAEARSAQKGQLDVPTARVFAKALGQNENSNGVGAWMSAAAQEECR